MLSFLEVNSGFIELSKKPHNPEFENWVELPNQVALRMLDSGVLQVRPAKAKGTALVLSCGVHGNETAPIEIISNQISRIVTGAIEPHCELLYILGNPESMQTSQRFVSLNMNRLFAGAYANYELNEDSKYEIERAKKLEELVSRFFEENSQLTKIHLDLHTAIKPSFHKTFAIRPYHQSAISPQSKRLLLALGIEAVLQHNKPSTTFSAFSVQKFNAEAYTLELGKVKPFGENNPEDFSAAIQTLDDLVQSSSIVEHNADSLIEYKVVAEIMKNSDEFKFYVPDDVENFTAYPQGYLIAEDFDYNYRVAFERESVVFPNINVPVGQRVAIMVTEVNPD
ncbi:succinylglutamate desuccinylase [Aliikangiella marina]|uniref:succinylglutamate desuccinylase n=1 Tax=Aliikangiella marina TaxID=1712262 RepID=UPI00163D61EF|nr:succinylglutamate desuccinylase [Aliikangiella marina]